MSRYAKETTVPVAKSRAEIEQVLERCGASQFISGWSENKAVIGFSMSSRQVKFILPLPDIEEYKLTPSTRKPRSPDAQRAAWEQGCRQRWRALLLVIKAKLEAVESGITEFDDEFMAHIVLPNGQTIGDCMKPQIEEAYSSGDMPPLLPHYGEREA